MLKIHLSSVEADSVYGEEWIQQIGRQITEFLQGNATWIGLQPERATEGSESQGAPVSMLDYACGHGVASKVSGRVPSESKQQETNHGGLKLFRLYTPMFPQYEE